jgi:two-component system, response regulator RegA
MTDKLKLLFLEDDHALATVTQRALTQRGFDVQHYQSIEETLKGMHNGHYQYALLDLKLDDGTSLNLIEEFVKTWPDIKIVVLTGYASIATAVQAIKYGAANYLSKPASIDQILRAFDEQDDPADEASAMALGRMEWEYIQQALQDNDGNISATARQLKMHRRTLQRKLSKKPLAE